MKLPKEAIWLMLLAAVLLLLISKMHGETPRHYQRRIQRHMDSALGRLALVSMNARPDSPDELYVIRGEMDIALVRLYLGHYRHNHTNRPFLDHALKQLDRDMEDYPPQVAGK